MTIEIDCKLKFTTSIGNLSRSKWL